MHAYVVKAPPPETPDLAVWVYPPMPHARARACSVLSAADTGS